MWHLSLDLGVDLCVYLFNGYWDLILFNLRATCRWTATSCTESSDTMCETSQFNYCRVEAAHMRKRRLMSAGVSLLSQRRSNDCDLSSRSSSLKKSLQGAKFQRHMMSSELERLSTRLFSKWARISQNKVYCIVLPCSKSQDPAFNSPDFMGALPQHFMLIHEPTGIPKSWRISCQMAAIPRPSNLADSAIFQGLTWEQSLQGNHLHQLQAVLIQLEDLFTSSWRNQCIWLTLQLQIFWEARFLSLPAAGCLDCASSLALRRSSAMLTLKFSTYSSFFQRL